MDKLDQNFAALEYLAGANDDRYLSLFRGIKDDWCDPATGFVYLGMRRAPAARRNHHAREGGLVEHYLEMWKMHTIIQSGLNGSMVLSYDKLPDPVVFRGIINHDLHKAYYDYRLIPSKLWAVEYSELDHRVLLTQNGKTMFLLSQWKIRLDIIDINLIQYSEGGWCEHEPRERSSLATYVYLLDEMSGNVVDRINTGTDYIQRPSRR